MRPHKAIQKSGDWAGNADDVSPWQSAGSKVPGVHGYKFQSATTSSLDDAWCPLTLIPTNRSGERTKSEQRALLAHTVMPCPVCLQLDQVTAWAKKSRPCDPVTSDHRARHRCNVHHGANAIISPSSRPPGLELRFEPDTHPSPSSSP